MTPDEAAAVLGVAAHEILDTRTAESGLEVLHHDMSSHVEQWRPVPGTADQPAPAEEAPPSDVAPAAPKRGRPRKAT